MFPWLLALYLGLLLLITALLRWRRGRPRDGREHFVAGGSLSAGVTGCSLAVTSVGGSSVVITSALVYRHGLAGLWMELAGALGFLALGLLLARRVRRSGVTSIAELAGRRYGPQIRRAVALVVLITELGWLALQARATTEITAPLLPGVASWQIVAATLAIVVCYTLLGGQYAVAYTDLLQIGMMALGFGLIAPWACLEQLSVETWRSLRWDFPVSASFGPGQVVAFLVLAGLPHLVGSDIYAKILSARDERAAARGALLAAGLKLCFGLAVAFVSLCGAALVGPLADPGQLIPRLLYQVLPAGIAAVVLVGLVATLQSTADQVLLSAVTMVGNDLWPRRAAIPLATLALGGSAFLLAVIFPTLIGLMKIAYTVFAAGLALPVLTSVLPGLRLPPRAVLAAIFGGSLLGGGLHLAALAGAGWPGDPVLWGVSLNALCLAGGAWLGRQTAGDADAPPPG